jgi:hypothetical protein
MSIQIPPLFFYLPLFTSEASGSNSLSTSGIQTAHYTYNGESISISASASVTNIYDGTRNDYARVEQVNTDFLTGNVLELVLQQYVENFNNDYGTN